MPRRSEDIIIDSGDMASDITSEAVPLDHLAGVAVQFDWSGSGLDGVVFIEASNDGVTFALVDGSETVIDSDSGTGILNAWQTFYRYFRVGYTATSGTGALTVSFHAKG